MKVRCIYEENIRNRLPGVCIPIQKFCKFQYLRDVNLNSVKYDRIFDLSFDEFKRNVNFIAQRKENWNNYRVSSILKLPILYRDMMNYGKWRDPIVFTPYEHTVPDDGSGRTLVSKIFFPDMPYDLLYYEKEHDDLNSLKELINIFHDNVNPGSYEVIDVYYKLYGDFAYSRQIEFLKEEKEVKEFCGSWTLDIVQELTSTLFKEMMRKIRSSPPQTDEDYIELLKYLVKMDYKFNSKSISY